MDADEARLQELLRARDQLIERRRTAENVGAPRVRLHAFDCELADTVGTIQGLCARAGLDLPPSVPPLKQSRVQSLAIAQAILERHLALLRSHRVVHEAAMRAGHEDSAKALARMIQFDEATIRKQCERAGLPIPNEVLDDQ